MNCEEKNSTEKTSEITHKISEEETTDKKSGDKSEKDMGAEEAKKLMDTITDKTCMFLLCQFLSISTQLINLPVQGPSLYVRI